MGFQLAVFSLQAPSVWLNLGSARSGASRGGAAHHDPRALEGVREQVLEALALARAPGN